MTDIPATPSPAASPTAGIARDTSRLGSSTNLKKAGEKFEAVFIGMMMKSMRQAKLTTDEDSLFDQKNSNTFRDMQDQRVAQSMAEHQPIGIGKAMTDFLAKSQKGLQTSGNPTAATPAASGSATS
ncbi:MAG: rod-binding protein [Sphingomonas sp.]|uniref:rod-binding protein n=1 Tax=Sphingomonas sp. TaxID=28214 RepID=UPI001AC7FB63|nr:rod-binding protein [Sphingomonas sp.]MBN8807992.1 rod-binding protein [Sphingomonas sp.]